jgi:hypothetical protein
MSTNDTSLPPPSNGSLLPGNGTDVPSSPIPDPLLLTGMSISEHAAYLSRIYIGVTATLLFFCTLTFVRRIYLRVRPVWTIGLDDYFIIVGYVSALLR